MSKKYSGPNRKPRKGGTIALRVVSIIFLVLIVVSAILIFVQPAYQATLGSEAMQGFLEPFSTHVNMHCRWILFFDETFAHYDYYQTGLVEAWILITSALLLIYFYFKAIAIIGYIRRTHKKGRPFRYVMLVLVAATNAVIALFLLGVQLRNELGEFSLALGRFYDGMVENVFNSISQNATLLKIYTFGDIVTNPSACFFIYVILITVLANIILDSLLAAGRKHLQKEKRSHAGDERYLAARSNQTEEALLVGALSSGPYVKDKKPLPADGYETNLVGEIVKTPVETEQVVVTEPNAVMEQVALEPLKPADRVDELGQPLPAPTEPAPVEKVVPTRRELAILNMLEPYNLSVVPELPGLYKTDVNKVVADLEPDTLEAAQVPVEGEETASDNAFKENELQREVPVLPGVDEWGADPWTDTRPDTDSESPLLNLHESLEQEADVTEVAAPVEEEAPVEEAAHVEEEPVVEEATEEEKGEIEEIEKNLLGEEEKAEEAPAEEVKEEVVEEEVVEEVVEEDNGRRDEPIEAESQVNNEHEDVETKPVDIDNDWKLPEYVEEEEKPAEEPVKEEPVEEVKKPVASVKPVAPLTPNIKQDTNKPTIIAPITPIKPAEEPVEEAAPVEETKIAPISGPMHAINKAAKKDIKPVEARRVKFDLKKYRIKTYSGSLSASEAFNLGVTKVQPTVVPVMANQDTNEASWKTRRREEEIRKNGYTDVTTVDDLTPVKPVSKGPDLTKANSIRDLVKANKAAATEEAVEETPAAEENKPVKPIAPITPVEPVKQEAVEEKPEEVKAEAKPIAGPLNPIKKPTNGPKPKPIAPIKPVNPNKK